MFRSFQTGPDRPSSADMGTRAYYALEGLALVPAENREALRRLLTPPLQQSGDKLITADQLAAELGKNRDRWAEPDPALIRHAQRLIARYQSLVQYYGGASRELGTAYTLEAGLADTLPVLAARLELAIPDRVNFPPRGTTNSGIFVQALARFEVALLESTRLTPTDFFREASLRDVPRDGALYRYFVLAGIGKSGDSKSPLYQSLKGP